MPNRLSHGSPSYSYLPSLCLARFTKFIECTRDDTLSNLVVCLHLDTPVHPHLSLYLFQATPALELGPFRDLIWL